MAELQTEIPRSPLAGHTLDLARTPVGRGWDFEYDTTRQEFAFVQQPDNGLMCLTRLPVAAEMATIYPSNYYAFSDETTQPWLVGIVRNWLEERKVAAYRRLVPQHQADVLDIGCGDGRLLTIIQKHTPTGWRFAGVEIGAEGAAAARAKGYDIIHASVEDAEAPEWNGRFDLIMMHQLIEHVRDPAMLLEKAARWLKPGGILSIETPESTGWDFALFKRRYWGGYHFPRHFFIFNRATLSQMAAEKGLKVYSVKSILSPMFWVHSLRNWWADKPSLNWLRRVFSPSNVILLCIATGLEVVQLALTKKSSNLQMLLRRPA